MGANIDRSSIKELNNVDFLIEQLGNRLALSLRKLEFDKPTTTGCEDCGIRRH